MKSTFRKCYVFVVEGENTKGRDTGHFEISINEFMKTLPVYFETLTNTDEKISVYVGHLDDIQLDKIGE